MNEVTKELIERLTENFQNFFLGGIKFSETREDGTREGE